ncbi:MAG: DUF1080 domain-containing protein [Planctomycetota bacterium]|nr:MAG: DUF1080 domain-containing protein [Planctomycetota bacterium]REK31308.1 MAG: DUF1080 domain-containing protein [Planctomycetota bacterium]REK39033.1 MAG: DUF1080 domain-containing protein [Planctomycetota bacterium]
MNRLFLFLIVTSLWISTPHSQLLRADDAAVAVEGEESLLALPSLKDLVAQVQPSIVVVSFSGRDGKPQGIGAGFVLSEDGLIATNLHVIGEARPISVRTLDGAEYDVTTVHAHERSQDLAILKVDAEGLKPLEIGDSDDLEQGQPVVAFGNPQGLEHSVVAGIVSGLREDVDGMSMIQLAIPIEQGNSGGPLVDLEGRVHGLLTLKSLVTDNLGYAVTINSLKPLLENPNPIPMSKWLTIGRLNPRRWEAPDDAVRWTQRAGRVRAEGQGSGFGGRSLCLSTVDAPESPFEVAVTVRIDQEDGAAGLIFHSDGEDRHYGFYPSSGKLRFSRFDGPTVYDWHVLRDERHAAYKADDWNRLRVRIDGDHFACYCNDELVFEVSDSTYASGRVGLAKFRHTTATFKGFAVGDELPSLRVTPELMERIDELVADIPTPRPPRQSLIDEVADAGEGSRRALEARALDLEQQAQRLRELSLAVHEGRVREKLTAVLSEEEAEVDLLHAALLIAALDNDELDVAVYLETVGDMAQEFLASLPEDVSEEDRLAAFHTYLFEEQGFHGSRTNYYRASNSYLNEVIDDREGLPITLSVLYIELARRVGIEAAGIGLPGHFVVQWAPNEGEPRLIDVFDRGREMTHEEAVAQATGRGLAWDEEYLRPQTADEIITRMLRNLINVANDAQDAEAALRYTDTVLAIDPESAQDRLFRAVLCYTTGRAEEGLVEVDWILDRRPEGILIGRIQQLRQALEELRDSQE